MCAFLNQDKPASGEPRDTETVLRGSGRGGGKRPGSGTSPAAYFISGSEQTVHRFLRRLREQLPLIQAVEAPPTPVQDFVAKEAVWLFVRDPADLNETEQTSLAAICQASDTASMIYQLTQQFRHMLHQREGEKLDDWLEKVRASQIRELQSFVVGVERDKAAVVAGLTLPQTNDHVA